MAARLKREQSAYAAMGFTEMGIFWDWMSLWQRDGSMWRPFMYRPDEKLTAKQRTAKQRYVTSRVCRACPLWNPRQYLRCFGRFLCSPQQSPAASAHPSVRSFLADRGGGALDPVVSHRVDGLVVRTSRDNVLLTHWASLPLRVASALLRGLGMVCQLGANPLLHLLS